MSNQIEDAIQFACARAWLTDDTREVSVEQNGVINVLAPQHTPLGAFVIGRAYYRPEVKLNDGVWEGV